MKGNRNKEPIGLHGWIYSWFTAISLILAYWGYLFFLTVGSILERKESSGDSREYLLFLVFLFSNTVSCIIFFLLYIKKIPVYENSKYRRFLAYVILVIFVFIVPCVTVFYVLYRVIYSFIGALVISPENAILSLSYIILGIECIFMFVYYSLEPYLTVKLNLIKLIYLSAIDKEKLSKSIFQLDQVNEKEDDEMMNKFVMLDDNNGEYIMTNEDFQEICDILRVYSNFFKFFIIFILGIFVIFFILITLKSFTKTKLLPSWAETMLSSLFLILLPKLSSLIFFPRVDIATFSNVIRVAEALDYWMNKKNLKLTKLRMAEKFELSTFEKLVIKKSQRNYLFCGCCHHFLLKWNDKYRLVKYID